MVILSGGGESSDEVDDDANKCECGVWSVFGTTEALL